MQAQGCRHGAKLADPGAANTPNATITMGNGDHTVASSPQQCDSTLAPHPILAYNRADNGQERVG